MPKFNPNPTPLEQVRRQQGLTRKKLAEKSGVSLYTLMCYEQRRYEFNNASVTKALSIADALGVDVKKILNPQENALPSEDP